MKREEVKQILGEGATEEQISAVLNMYHSQKTELDKANSEISKYKNSYEEAVKESNSYKSELDKINEANLTKEEQLAKREKEIAEKGENATYFEKTLANSMNEFNKHLSSNRNFKENSTKYLQRRVNRPGVLLEVGFLSNSSERALLTSEVYQNKLVNVIKGGIYKYFET